MKKILVVRYGALGDLVVTLPVLQSLQQSGYYVTLAGNGRYRDFFLQYGYIDEFIPSDGSFFLPLFAGNSEDSVVKYLHKFNVIVSYTDEAEPFSLGLKRSFTGKIIFHSVNPSEVHGHIIQHLLEPVRHIAYSITEVPEIKIRLPKKRKYCIIHPGSGSIKKNWDKEKFLEVYRLLSEEKDCFILLGHAEDHMQDFWQKNIPVEKIINLPNMNTLMDYVRETEIYIGNDSGISHLFAASGVFSIIIFRTTSPLVWSPKGKNVKILYKSLDDEPENISVGEGSERERINSVTVADVMRTVNEYYGNRRKV